MFIYSVSFRELTYVKNQRNTRFEGFRGSKSEQNRVSDRGYTNFVFDYVNNKAAIHFESHQHTNRKYLFIFVRNRINLFFGTMGSRSARFSVFRFSMCIDP
jgi:hypothetical protein